MIRPDRLSAAALLLVVATLGLKAATLDVEPVEDEARYASSLARRVADQGFGTRIEGEGSLRVVGWRGACRIKARDLPPHGTARDAFELLARKVGPLRYAYDGSWRASPPKLRPLLAFYVQRELARIGITVPRRSIVAIASSAGCGPIDPAISKVEIFLTNRT